MEDIAVSVICNTYNHEKYIRKALESFVMQKTEFAFEVLVHDDASKDKTAEIIREFEQKYPDIIKPIYQKENQYSKGVQISLVHQYPRSKGKYVAFCEGDDFWTDETKLQRQFDYMEAHSDCALVSCKAIKVTENGDYLDEYINYDFEKTKGILYFGDIIRQHGAISTASMFFRRSFYKENIDFLKSIKSFDYIVKTLLASTGYVYVLAQTMCAYRVAAMGSWTNRVAANSKKFAEHMKIAAENYKKLNGYTNYKFDKEFKEEILEREYYAHYYRAEFNVLRKPPFSEKYKKLTLKSKVKLFLWAKLPHLHSFLFKR